MKLSPKPLLAGMAVYFGMSAGTYIYVRSTKPPQSCDCQQLTKDGDMDVYERLADEYDNKIGFDETVMGIKLLRWWLIHKLEVETAVPLSVCTCLCRSNLQDIFRTECFTLIFMFVPLLPFAGKCSGGLCWNRSQSAILQLRQVIVPNADRHQQANADQCPGEVQRS